MRGRERRRERYTSVFLRGGTWVLFDCWKYEQEKSVEGKEERSALPFRLVQFGVAIGGRSTDSLFTSRRDVGGTGSLEDRLRAVDLVPGIAMSGQQHAAFLDPSLVP